MRASITWTLAVAGSLGGCTDPEPEPEPIIATIPVAPCPPDPALDEVETIASGTVVDYETGAPRPGVTVDIARVFELDAVFPADSCSLARLTTDADGRFGPLTVKIGPRPGLFDNKYVVFLAQGGGIAPTASDAQVSGATVDHRIAAPSLELIDAWRAELDDGGMENARRGGLILYRYEEQGDTPAPRVTAQRNTLFGRDLAPGDEVRYLLEDGLTMAPRSRTSTTRSGLALIGLEPGPTGIREIGGSRGMDTWGDIACLVGEGWLFVEWTDRFNP